MGIFKRMKDIASADLHNRLDKVEDPIKMLKQYLRELEKEIQKGKNSLANQMFVVKKYEALIAETNETIEKRASQAELAISQNEEELAKMAIEEKINLEKKLTSYQSQLDSVKNQTEALVQQLNRMKEKYEELSNRKLTLLSRAAAAQASDTFGQSLISLNSENALYGFSRIEDKIVEMEAKASANQYLLSKATLDNYKELPSLLDVEVEQELGKLKECLVKQT
ncbi:PspA/IM30 family protein [Niallia oryzisoli]|uniref:PspA/IM30 family protein n=1 Tax=Niallia oryzisoli TaxID=1737571 RepID=UPI0037367F1B